MRVVSVNISEKKGTRKVSRPEAVLKTNWGIEGDSHADGSHRQLSLHISHRHPFPHRGGYPP